MMSNFRRWTDTEEKPSLVFCCINYLSTFLRFLLQYVCILGPSCVLCCDVEHCNGFEDMLSLGSTAVWQHCIDPLSVYSQFTQQPAGMPFVGLVWSSGLLV